MKNKHCEDIKWKITSKVAWLIVPYILAKNRDAIYWWIEKLNSLRLFTRSKPRVMIEDCCYRFHGRMPHQRYEFFSFFYWNSVKARINRSKTGCNEQKFFLLLKHNFRSRFRCLILRDSPSSEPDASVLLSIANDTFPHRNGHNNRADL